jgi:hypothetical protein
MRLKAPRGYGWLTNPKKAAYNRIYNRTSRGCLVSLIAISILLASVFLAITSAFAGGKTVYVHDYTRKDGTYVHPHYRSAPGTASHLPSTVSHYVPNTATESTTTTSAPVVLLFRIRLPCAFMAITGRMERTFKSTSALRRVLPTQLSARLRESPSTPLPLLSKRPLSLPLPLLLSLPQRTRRTVIRLRQAVSEIHTDELNEVNLRSTILCG